MSRNSRTWSNGIISLYLPVSTFEQLVDKANRIQGQEQGETGGEERCRRCGKCPLDESLVAGIHEIYNETPIRQKRRYGHYGKNFETVYGEEATFLDSSIFIGAFFEEKLIGFVKLVPDETFTQAGLMNIVSMIKHRDKVPQNALIAYAVRACASRGIPYLVYSKFDYGHGKKENDGLRDFKERNGFGRVDTPRYYVPLTALGWAAFRLGLHRKMADRIPEPVACRLRELRTLWYKRKYRLVETF